MSCLGKIFVMAADALDVVIDYWLPVPGARRAHHAHSVVGQDFSEGPSEKLTDWQARQAQGAMQDMGCRHAAELFPQHTKFAAAAADVAVKRPDPAGFPGAGSGQPETSGAAENPLLLGCGGTGPGLIDDIARRMFEESFPGDVHLWDEVTHSTRERWRRNARAVVAHFNVTPK